MLCHLSHFEFAIPICVAQDLSLCPLL